jgi:hypothetical protein
LALPCPAGRFDPLVAEDRSAEGVRGRRESEPAVAQWRWSVLGPYGIGSPGSRRASTGTVGMRESQVTGHSHPRPREGNGAGPGSSPPPGLPTDHGANNGLAVAATSCQSFPRPEWCGDVPSGFINASSFTIRSWSFVKQTRTSLFHKALVVSAGPPFVTLPRRRPARVAGDPRRRGWRCRR